MLTRMVNDVNVLCLSFFYVLQPDKLKRCALYEKINVHFFFISKLLSKFAHLIRKTTH